MPVGICTAAELNDVSKTQEVRLLALAELGVTTVLYNAKNYRRVGEAAKAEAEKLTAPVPPA